MSHQDSKKYEEYLTAYDEYQALGATGGTDNPSSEGEGVKTDPGSYSHQLKSGKTYPCVETGRQSPPLSPKRKIPTPPPQPPTNRTSSPQALPNMPATNSPTNTQTSMGTQQQTQQVGAPIKVMPTDASVREFTYADDDYNARDFIRQCEFNMGNSGIFDDVDRINFVCARVKQGSQASHMMRVSAITRSIERKVYSDFRDHFLRVFGQNYKHNMVKGVTLAVQRILEGVNSQSPDKAQVGANIVSTDLEKYLKDNNWGDARGMEWDKILLFLEFFAYMLLLNGKARDGAVSLSFKPTDELLEFVTKLKDKIEATRAESASIAAAVGVSQVTSGISALSLEPTSSADPGVKSVAVCSFCNKPGHSEVKCFALRRERREKRKKQTQGEASGNHPSASTHPKPDRDRRQPSVGANKWSTQQYNPIPGGAGNVYCHLHQNNSHSTADCYTIAKLRKDWRDPPAQGNRRGGGTPSGEGARPKRYDPT